GQSERAVSAGGRMRKLTVGGQLSVLCALAALQVQGGDSIRTDVRVASGSTPSGSSRHSFAPAYTPDGRLQLPERYREWIFVSSGLDMTYHEKPTTPTHSVFDNVFANPPAYQQFVSTGTWPNGTLLVMEERAATSKGSINQSGAFQSGDELHIEVHAKDTARF